MNEQVRAAFREQAGWCEKLGSPFTARLCRLLAERLNDRIPAAQAILQWPGNPSATADALPLRGAGALHCLARADQLSDLARCYPPHSVTDDLLWLAIESALIRGEGVIRTYLASAPQTNEVMRSAALFPGLLSIAHLTQQPLHLYEIGASAGLNLIPDRYRYQFGDATWGQSTSPLLLAPEWHGPAPPVTAPIDIRTRRGVDLNPVDLSNPGARKRLLSYVWPDQPERLQRLESAITLLVAERPIIDRADAGEWLERTLATEAPEGVRVIYHSITWNYLSTSTQQRMRQTIQRRAAQASASSSLAWLRLELAPKAAALQLTLWPGGEEHLLASAHPHGSLVQWLG